MIKSLLTCLGMVVLSVPSYGQAINQKMLVGKWYLVRHCIDSTLVMDLEHPEATVNYYLTMLSKKRPDCTRQDSVDMEENVHYTMEGFQNYYIEYKEDYTYRNTVIKRNANEVGDETEGGTYIFIPAEQKIIQTESDGTIHEVRAFMKGKILRLEIATRGKKYCMELKKR